MQKTKHNRLKKEIDKTTTLIGDFDIYLSLIENLETDLIGYTHTHIQAYKYKQRERERLGL